MTQQGDSVQATALHADRDDAPRTAPRPPWRRWRLDFADRAALAMWAAAHVVLLILAWAAGWVFRSGSASAPPTAAFPRWDASLLQNIAQWGYLSPHSSPNTAAFFPGYPIALAAVHLALRNWTLSGLALSGVAGCFAVVSLARLAGDRRAVAVLLAMPAAVFLMLGYGEVLYLALAIPAWRAATAGRWPRAALLTAFAGLARPDAAFMIAGLLVMAVTGPRGRRLAGAARSLAALAGPAAYEAYLWARTGAWDEWLRAQQAGWDMHVVSPLSALRTTWKFAFGHEWAAGFAFEYQLEIASVGVMLAATVAFAACRRWPEAAYCGAAFAAVATQTWYQGCPRTLLVLFPVWVAIARTGERRPWARWAYFTVCAPLAVVVGLMFLAGQWAG